MRRLPIFLAAVLSFPLLAQTPYLLKDFNTSYSAGTKGSSPGGFTAWGSRTLFVATTDAAGTELWVTDDTAAGTSMVADIVPGSASSSPGPMIVVNGVLLFPARDANHGIELWTSDGTPAGTHLFLDINPGPSSANPGSMTIFNNRMLFTADDGTNGRELWTTDGTVAGTHMVKDVTPGSSSTSIGSLTVLGERVYFVTSSGLWKTDGTDAGTTKVSDVIGRDFRVVGTRLFFEGYTEAAGLELWVSDGTSAGTHMVTEILPGVAGAFDSNYSVLGMTVLGNGVIFPANDGVHGRELWYSDGTAAGTHMIRDFTPGPKGTWDTSYAYVTAFNGRAYFPFYDAIHGAQPWITDGTDAGTSLFADLVPGTAGLSVGGFLVAGNKLYFPVLDGPSGPYKLWVSDGTPGGTHSLDVAVSGNWGGVNGKLYFTGTDYLTGTEPWVTDGTTAGTHVVANIAADDPPSSNPGSFHTAGKYLFFSVSEGINPSGSGLSGGLWRTDGTIAGTVRLTSITGSIDFYSYLTAGPLLFFTSWNSDRTKATLMQSDGTVEGTKPADAFLDRFGGNKPKAFYTFGDDVFASVYNDTNQSTTVLWKTSITPGGTATRLGPANNGTLTDFGGHRLFIGQSATNYFRDSLWSTDGTPAGTFAVIPDLGDIDFYPQGPVNVAGTAFFIDALHADSTSKLWKSDGTADGTVVVKPLPFLLGGGTIFQVAGHRLFFTTGISIWTSDGTDAGTFELLKIGLDAYQTQPMAVAGNRLVFVAYTSGQPLQLWSSDGTVGGTRRIPNVTPTSSNLLGADGRIYFTATDADHGAEIWVTDGMEEGTKMLFDLNPGPAGSNPYQLTRIGNSICFGATTPSTGYELWAFPVTGGVLAINDTRAAEGDSGNASVAHFTVSLSQPLTSSVTVDYATSDGTAKAGEDYDAANGTLTFAAGEASKVIDVHVRGDVISENNETFYVTLSNAHGASVVTSEGVAIIDDDDQWADLGVVPRFTIDPTASFDGGVKVTNQGPRIATDVLVTLNSTPGAALDNRCTSCPIPQIASGESAQTGGGSFYASATQSFLSATATARQRDPQLSNNVATWTYNGDMAMNAAYLVPGQTATITTRVYNASNTAISASVPNILAFQPAVTNVANGYATFSVTALTAGSTTIGISGQQYPLQVNVVAAGAQPRWPYGLSFGADRTALTFDRPLYVSVIPNGRALSNGATATGTVTVTAGNQQLASQAFSGTAQVTFPAYLRSLGQVNYSMNYSGDANFLPQTINGSVYVYPGTAVLTGSLDMVPGAAAGTFALTVRASGSPAAAPGGTLSVYAGTTKVATVSLTASGSGVSIGQATLTGLSTAPTLTVNYSGDAFYLAGSQQFRAASSRHHLVKH